jgi:hypothetical protein
MRNGKAAQGEELQMWEGKGTTDPEAREWKRFPSISSFNSSFSKALAKQ